MPYFVLTQLFALCERQILLSTLHAMLSEALSQHPFIAITTFHASLTSLYVLFIKWSLN